MTPQLSLIRFKNFFVCTTTYKFTVTVISLFVAGVVGYHTLVLDDHDILKYAFMVSKNKVMVALKGSGDYLNVGAKELYLLLEKCICAK